MVCVTEQKTCERLIREGAKIAGEKGLNVVHVVRNGDMMLGKSSDGDALDYLYGIAKEYGAEMDILRSDNVIETIVTFAKKRGTRYVVIGSTREREGVDFSNQLRAMLPGKKIIVVP